MEATIDIRTADGNVNILLEDAQVGAIREVLVDLCLSTMAVFAMLIDAAGRVVASGGDTKEFQLEDIAALAAGDLATSRQLANMLNEPEFSLLFQHEKQKNLFMTAIESDAILIVVFDVETTFGALRLRIRRSISLLQQILHQARRTTVVALSEASEISADEDLHRKDVDELMAVNVPPAVPARRTEPVPSQTPALANQNSPMLPATATPPSQTPALANQNSPVSPKAAPVTHASEAMTPSTAAAAPKPEPEKSRGVDIPPPAAKKQAAMPATAPGVPSSPPVPAGKGLSPALVAEIRKILAWFEAFKGWKLVFNDEVEFMARGLERGNSREEETLRSIFLRTRARLTEQKRLLEARFRLIQSLYQQFVTVLQMVMKGAWRDEVVDRAMKAAFSGVGMDQNMVGAGIVKRDGAWGFDFGTVGKQLVTVCHSHNMNYHQGMLEMLRQLNAALSALSAFIIEDARLREELSRQWARLFRHYSDGLKTLDLEPDVLDLFRPLVKSGSLPK